MTKFDDLIRHLEEGEGPDRGLDKAIMCWLYPKVPEDQWGSQDAPAFTNSLDACNKLQEKLLPGWKRRTIQRGYAWQCVIQKAENSSVYSGLHPASEPRAWLVAILRAKEAES